MGKHLPFQDHTARYCPGSRIMENGSIAPTAFHLRPGERYLSVEWLEKLNQPTRSDEIHKVIKILSSKLKLGSTAKIAVLHIDTVCQYVRESSMLTIGFFHEPTPDDPAHSGLHGTQQDEILISELIVEKIDEVFPIDRA